MPRILLSTLAVVFALPMAANAHKMWLLPSQTVLSGTAPLVTFDAAISNDLFYFNHHAMRLDRLSITAPDGTPASAENLATGRYRSVFDVPLHQSGTYRIAVPMGGLTASWQVNGEQKRWRGSAEEFAANVPAEAQQLKVTESINRVETFVTNGAPTEESLKPSGKGLELVPVTHPNDLYAGEEAQFRLLVDGKPAAGLQVEIVRGGTRYRDAQDEILVTTNADGTFAVQWPEPGMYWLETSTSDQKTTVPQAGQRRLGYSATLEVLAP